MKTYQLGVAALVAAGLVASGFSSLAQAADQLLSGSIASASGEKLDGVTVSAKQDGSTITTSVYTDEQRRLLFPAAAGRQVPGLGAGARLRDRQGRGRSHRAPRTRTSRSSRSPIRSSGCASCRAKCWSRRCPRTPTEDANIKKIFTNQCTGCHTPGYPLQFRFDEAGWNKIINLMKVIAGHRRLSGPNAKPNGIIEFNQKELAAYLARARGPGETSMKFKERPRPTGEAARVVWTTYDCRSTRMPASAPTPSTTPMTAPTGRSAPPPSSASCPMTAAWASTAISISPSTTPTGCVTIGKVDTKTGEVKYLKVDRNDGRAATAHGLMRDGEGNFWFDVNPGRRSLGKLDAKTEKISVYQTPQQHVAARRRRDHGRRRQGQDLGLGAGRRACASIR